MIVCKGFLVSKMTFSDSCLVLEKWKKENNDRFWEENGNDVEDLGGGIFGCRYCRLQFSTTREAMAKHIVDHVEDNYIKLAEITEVAKHSGKWRPEWHEYSSDKKLWGHGGNACTRNSYCQLEPNWWTGSCHAGDVGSQKRGGK